MVAFEWQGFTPLKDDLEDIRKSVNLQTSQAFAKVRDLAPKPKNVQQILAESDPHVPLVATATDGLIPTMPKPRSPVPSESSAPSVPSESSVRVPQGMVVVDARGQVLSEVQGVKTCKDAAKNDMEGLKRRPEHQLEGLQVQYTLCSRQL
jgi:hypothetical protein